MQNILKVMFDLNANIIASIGNYTDCLLRYGHFITAGPRLFVNVCARLSVLASKYITPFCRYYRLNSLSRIRVVHVRTMSPAWAVYPMCPVAGHHSNSHASYERWRHPAIRPFCWWPILRSALHVPITCTVQHVPEIRGVSGLLSMLAAHDVDATMIQCAR